MAKPTRKTMWTTHRGRRIVRGTWVGVGVVAGLWIVSGMLSGGGEEPSAATTAAEADASLAEFGLVAQEPEVAPALADPFTPEEGVNLLGEEAISEPDVETSTDPGEYQAAVATAADVVAHYATYSWQDDPQDWVAALPSLTEEYRGALEETTATTWPALEADEIVVEGSVVTSSPQVTDFDASEGTARAAVTVSQQVTRAGDDAPEAMSRSYAVSLVKVSDDDEETEEWLVDAVQSS